MALARDVRILVALQLVLVAITSTVFFIIYGGFQAGSAGFGGLVAASNTGLLLWRQRGADTGRALSAGASLRLLYRSALERFVVIALLFALGLGIWRLDPLAALAGFVTGQLALVFMGMKGKSESHVV
ncbi:MAG: ATP synthase subunit I [Gammaproteobacteria bacterium]